MSELRDALNSAFEKEEANEPETVEVQSAVPSEAENEVSASTEAAPDAERAATEAKTETVPTEAEKPDPTGKAPEAQPSEQAKEIHRVDRAPASWKKETKGEWAALPLHVRQEVHRREMEINRALNETNNIRQQAAQYDQTVQPYMARIQSLGVTPVQAVGELLKADYLLATGTPQQKAQFIDKLLQDYGVDIAALDAAISARLGGQQQPQQQPAFDPNQITTLVQQQLNQALAPIYQQRQQQEQQIQQQAVQSVEQMSLDPRFPHFDEVREEMADIMEMKFKRGVEITPEQAYNIAIQSNPQLSAMRQATQQNQFAQRAKAAAVSVSGAPVGGGQQSHVTSGNLRDDIEAAFGGNRL